MVYREVSSSDMDYQGGNQYVHESWVGVFTLERADCDHLNITEWEAARCEATRRKPMQCERFGADRDGREPGGEWIRVYVWLSLCAIHLKLS